MAFDMSSKSTDAFIARTQALATRFRKQRPLRAGSLLVTMLGDSIAPRGGSIALSSLIRLAEPFGLTDRLVRTSVGRLANDRWVTSTKIGRASFYTLTRHGRVLFAKATQRIYGVSPDEWDGNWTLIIVPPELKKMRGDIREELSWLGWGQLAPGVFAHPTYQREELHAWLAEFRAAERLVVVDAKSITSTDAQLVSIGWNLGELGRRYRRFISMFSAVNDALARRGGDLHGETCFVLRTLLLHEYRKIHLRDPLLPPSLLPPDWPGAEAYALVGTLYSRAFAASEQHLSEVCRTLDGELPLPTADVFDRFGGISRA